MNIATMGRSLNFWRMFKLGKGKFQQKGLVVSYCPGRRALGGEQEGRVMRMV